MTPTFSPDPAGHGHRIDFAARPRLFTIAFALLWFSGWLLLLTLTVLDYKRFGTLNLLGMVILAAGPPVALALLWVASGKRESLLVTPAEVRIDRWAGPIRLSRRFESQAITGVRVAEASGGPLVDLVALRQGLRPLASRRARSWHRAPVVHRYSHTALRDRGSGIGQEPRTRRLWPEGRWARAKLDRLLEALASAPHPAP